MTQDEILQVSDEKILSEIKGLQYLFRSSEVIRHGLHRDEEQYKTQSVAEHISNIMILCEYFIPLEDSESTWDRYKIHQMIMWHDLGEIETGDFPTHEKNEQIEQNEHHAQRVVITQSPSLLRHNIETVLNEYEERQSIESRFVKALDNLEAVLETFTETGMKRRRDHQKFSIEETEFYKEKVKQNTENFPVIRRFIDLAEQQIIENSLKGKIELDLQ